MDLLFSMNLIKKSSYVIANVTGPTHMAAHLGKKGIVLFGHHTTAKKVSIETEKFRAITVEDLNSLTAETVYSDIKICAFCKMNNLTSLLHRSDHHLFIAVFCENNKVTFQNVTYLNFVSRFLSLNNQFMGLFYEFMGAAFLK